MQSRRDIPANSRKLTNFEESVLVQYTLDLAAKEFPPRVSVVGDMTNRLLATFCVAFSAAMTENNIQGGFRGAGLLPFAPENVIYMLDLKLKTPTPPNARPGTCQMKHHES